MMKAAAGIAALLLLAAGTFALTQRESAAPPERPIAERPKLMLLTSLPLIFPEHFSLEGGGSKALEALESRYAVIPIATTDTASLRQAKLLLMAHPLAQPAESLVDLDNWVRTGGKVILLADPRLEWPSELPLGDKLRPPPAFADTGLLQRWGLRLETPPEAGPAERKLGGFKIVTDSPGELAGTCKVSSDRFVARCSIERGRAIVVADADFLNVDQADGATGHNLDALLAELSSLEH